MKLRFLEISTSRHGKETIYFRRSKGVRIRLPSVGAADFREHYDAAMAGKPLPHIRDMPVTKSEQRRQRVERAMREGLKGARSRSQTRDLAFNLSMDWLLNTVEQQDFRCALTGIEFYSKHTSSGKTNPFAPSLDRIDPKKGYTTDNVRIVILAVNLMLLDWGPEIFEQVANSFRYWKRHKTGKPMPAPLRINARTLNSFQ